MDDKLASLVRLHRWRLDEERRSLAEAIRKLDLLERQLHALEAELIAEQESVRVAPIEAGDAYGRFARVMVERRVSCRQAIAAAQADVAMHREKVRCCYRELRTFELSEDSRRLRAATDAARREGLILNEVALFVRSRSG
jgi:flagellar protein FliJ